MSVKEYSDTDLNIRLGQIRAKIGELKELEKNIRNEIAKRSGVKNIKKKIKATVKTMSKVLSTHKIDFNKNAKKRDLEELLRKHNLIRVATKLEIASNISSE